MALESGHRLARGSFRSGKGPDLLAESIHPPSRQLPSQTKRTRGPPSSRVPPPAHRIASLCLRPIRATSCILGDGPAGGSSPYRRSVVAGALAPSSLPTPMPRCGRGGAREARDAFTAQRTSVREEVAQPDPQRALRASWTPGNSLPGRRPAKPATAATRDRTSAQIFTGIPSGLFRSPTWSRACFIFSASDVNEGCTAGATSRFTPADSTTERRLVLDHRPGT
jgi:hypothetical protein